MSVNLARNFVLSLTALACSACSGISSKYPSAWPTVTPDHFACSKISGTYRNFADATYSPKGGSPYLTYRLGFDILSVAESDAIEAVTLECVGDHVIQAAISQRSGVREVRMIESGMGTWRISDGTIIFAAENDSEIDGFGGVLGRSYFSLSLASDGSLIGKQRDVSAALALWLVPIGGTQTFWFKWSRITP